MRAGKLQKGWIILALLTVTGYTCLRAAIKKIRGTVTRSWCNEELQRWVQRVMRLVRIQCVIVNPHQTKPKSGQPTIVMCNHSSLFDIPLSFLAFPDQALRMLAKKELANIPLMRQGMRAAEFPTIDRKNRRQAMKDLEGIKTQLQDGIVMWIAPEGTRSKDDKLGPFKKGPFITAIQAGATIIPIGIRGANHILPAGTLQLNLAQEVAVHIGEPIDATQYTLENKDTLLAHVFRVMQRLTDE